MADFGTFDLGRAYAQAADIKQSQQLGELRTLQIQDARKQLTEKTKDTPDMVIDRYRLMTALGQGALKSADPEQARQAAIAGISRGVELGALDPSVAPQMIEQLKTLPPDQVLPALTQTVGQYQAIVEQYDKKQTTPEKASFGNPQDGINPQTGKPGQFVTDNTGKQVWLTSTPIPPKPDAPRTPGYGSAQNGINPATGKPGQYVIDDFGNQKWLGSAPIPAAGAAGGKMTADERKVAYLATRLEGSLRKLTEIDALDTTASTPSWGEKLAGGVPIVGNETANLARSEPRQQAHAAQLDALDAALTIGTGAAYTREQLEGYAISYFPQIGDKPDAIADKKQRFSDLVAAARAAAGPAAVNIDKALGPSAGTGAPAAGLPQGVTEAEWNAMTPEEKALFQ